ncbi:hypothetical protein E4U17_007817 [Claviceps sp. LM77 group G4]|nr:hypothetical protein E4U17_007817 [Claviceps sp. LM77 group G4]KAG6069448.1 hypothetical protein E4U33_004823 [Claviceps sp. LM78 group G4]
MLVFSSRSKWPINVSFDNTCAMVTCISTALISLAPSEKLYYYDTSRPAASRRFYERHRKAGNANIYRNPLREMPTIPSSDSLEIILDNSRGTPISDDHDDTFAAIDGPLDSGDLDKQDAYDEAICELDIAQVDDGEEPDLPPLPPTPPPPLDRKEYPSTYLAC